MELKQLESFVCVVKYKSFTKAAKQLYISQPTISTHIRQLEEELHARLILRTTKSIEITSAGQELYEFANHILHLKKDLLSRLEKENTNTIYMGVSTIPSDYILPEVLPAFRKQYPEISFHIHQSDSQGVIDGLLNGSFHLGMVGMDSPEENVEFIPFFQDSMVLITPAAEPFLSMKKEPEVPLAELLKEPVLIREKGSGSKKCMDHYFEEMNIREENLNIIARLNNQESIKNLVASGFGISIISAKAARNMKEEQKILTFALPGYPATRNLYLVRRKNDRIPDTVTTFINFTKKFYI